MRRRDEMILFVVSKGAPLNHLIATRGGQKTSLFDPTPSELCFGLRLVLTCLSTFDSKICEIFEVIKILKY